MTTTIYTHSLFFKHETPSSHPESSKRLDALAETLKNYVQKEPQTRDIDHLILSAHTKNHLALIEESFIEDEITCIDGQDTYLSNHSIEAAKQAIVNFCQAIDDVKNDKIERAFCLSRPPGHHAEPNKVMGFCLFNTVFIGALHAQSIGFDKVVILDFDVHHGNGTDTMMRQNDNNNLYFISTHQGDHYPWTGNADTSTTHIYNFPIEANTGSPTMRELYLKRVLPTLKKINPDLVLLSAGFDAHENDPHGNLNWTTEDYHWLGAHLSMYKTVATLEGGYNLQALPLSVLNFIQGQDK